MSIDTKEKQRNKRSYLAKVMSNRMEKTVVVAVSRTFMHPIYKKVIRKTSRFKAHDERNECLVGDHVRIQVSRPLSKQKHWRVVEIISRSKGDKVGPEQSAVGSS